MDRKRLPVSRTSVTHKFTIHSHPVECLCPNCGKVINVEDSGNVVIYLTVGLFEDGMPGEVFIKLDRYGDTIKGFADQWAIQVSLALQYGTPLSVICEKGSYSRFEPCGYTDTLLYDSQGKPVGKVNATSIIDYICRWLKLKFLKHTQ